MTLYAAALFLHVVGVLLLAAALTAEGVALAQLRRAETSAAVRTWTGVATLARLFGPASAVTILVPGLYMMIASWGWVAWIAVGLVAWLAIAAIGAVNGIRFSTAAREASTDASAIPRLRGRAFAVSFWLRLSLALGIVFLMTAKPGLLGACVTVVVAAAAGVAVGPIASGVQRNAQGEPLAS